VNEFELIERLTTGLPLNASTRVGSGDDCAVLDLGLDGQWLIFKTDAVVDGVHFDTSALPEQIGHKAMGRCLSDVAAMGGCPTHALVTLGLPTGFDALRVERIYSGLRALATRYGVAIVGGETTTSPDRLFLSVALIGTVERGRCPLRSGARAGDAIFVTGELGGSLVSGRHLTFEPRVAEGRWLVERFEIHAMIDLSDGLAGDLRHVLKSSGVGAELQVDAIPVSAVVRGGGRLDNPSEADDATTKEMGGRLKSALSDGEDFELLFTLPAGQAVELMDGWRARFGGLKLSCIGRITSGTEVTLRGKDGIRPLELDGYVHFKGT
jgi:thiamine-monophosphate kinase